MATGVEGAVEGGAGTLSADFGAGLSACTPAPGDARAQAPAPRSRQHADGDQSGTDHLHLSQCHGRQYSLGKGRGRPGKGGIQRRRAGTETGTGRGTGRGGREEPIRRGHGGTHEARRDRGGEGRVDRSDPSPDERRGGCVAPAGEAVAEQRAAPRQAAPHGPDRPLELGGGLLVRPVVQVTEDQRHPVLLGQPVQLLVEGLADLGRFEGPRIGRRFQAIDPVRLPALPHLPMGSGPHRNLVGHAVEPAREPLPLADRRGFANQHQKRRLERVLDVAAGREGSGGRARGPSARAAGPGPRTPPRPVGSDTRSSSSPPPRGSVPSPKSLSSSRVNTPRPASIMVGSPVSLLVHNRVLQRRRPPNPEICPDFPGIRSPDGRRVASGEWRVADARHLGQPE